MESINVLAISQARTGSTRLPGKIFKHINSKTVLSLHIERIRRSKNIAQLMIATTTEPADDQVVQACAQLNLECFRGNTTHVLDRFYQAAKNKKAKWIVRLTSDCPLIDPIVIDAVIENALNNDVDYCSNTLNPTFPDGVDVEVFKFAALEKAWKEASTGSDKEHVTPYIHRNSTFNKNNMFTAFSFENDKDYSNVRLTVDEELDLEVIRTLVKNLGDDKGWLSYADYYLEHKELKELNSGIERNEGFKRSLDKDNT
jgi:spore coat polysaccharide biosynthesis protein SpsF